MIKRYQQPGESLEIKITETLFTLENRNFYMQLAKIRSI